MNNWEMFDLISSTWYGKRMYFVQDGAMRTASIFSRYSSRYLTFDEALEEFLQLIGDDGSV